VFCQLFGIAEQIGLQCAVFFRRGAAFAGACDGSDRDLVTEHPDEDFGGCNDDVKAAEVEVKHEGGRVGPAQRAVKREGRLCETLRPALAGNNLKDIARNDVIARFFHGGFVAIAGEVAGRFGRFDRVAQITRGAGGAAFEVAHRVHHAFGGLCVGRARALPVRGPCRVF